MSRTQVIQKGTFTCIRVPSPPAREIRVHQIVEVFRLIIMAGNIITFHTISPNFLSQFY